jgi:CRISPR/Cas system CSM-associated protein Csm3 (group 7 of RAMP superfamily)
MHRKIFTHRFLARIVTEAATPLSVGSGKGDMTSDRLILRDVNEMPYIPGTSLAGVLRHSLSMEESVKNQLFGYQRGDDGEGSRLIVSSAGLVGENEKVTDGINPLIQNAPFFSRFANLPVRQHVRITHRGAAADQGKFDEEVIFKGTRFCFELEMTGNNSEADQRAWNAIISKFHNPAFRIGGGTRKGFGEIKVVSCKSAILDLTTEIALNQYLEKSSSLADEKGWWKAFGGTGPEAFSNDEWTEYRLSLTPEDFFLFGSGLESEDADMTFVVEDVLTWDDNNNPTWKEKQTFIPASSLKGALAHRITYYYNKAAGITVEKLRENNALQFLLQLGFKINEGNFNSSKDSILEVVAQNNPAVVELFGQAKGEDEIKRGKVIFSDFFFENQPPKKLLNHVAIDRFTGGAMDGALFSEEVAFGKNLKAELLILVHNSLNNNELIINALEQTLADLCTGMLPLGGGTMRGHGCFNGTYYKNGKEVQQ